MPEVIHELPAIKESTQDYDKIEARIKALFRKYLYAPLLKSFSLKSKKIANAKKGLLDAIQSGKITYSEGAFRGQFNATTSKEIKELGAKWDRKTSSFKIPIEDIPYDVRSNVLFSESIFRGKLAAIDKRLGEISPEFIASQLKTADLFDSALFKVDHEFQKNVSKIKVMPKLSDEQRAKIAADWQNNMDLNIRSFSEKQIKELRQTVKDTYLAGNRYESLVKGIESSYGVTSRKAKFLAQNETMLLMSKFKEVRYVEAGAKQYKWGCVKMPHDKAPPAPHIKGNVRYSHGILEGHIFSFDSPPIITNPGQPEVRGNPGTIYNCRCFARPLIRFDKES